jgi:hypothetical protein
MIVAKSLLTTNVLQGLGSPLSSSRSNKSRKANTSSIYWDTIASNMDKTKKICVYHLFNMWKTAKMSHRWPSIYGNT